MSRLVRSHGNRILRLSDLTPLVDVALVLVVFFLLNAQVAEADAIPVSLPSAESGQRLDLPALVLTLLEDGSLLLGDEQIAVGDLAEIAGEHAEAVIRADTGCRYGRVVEIEDVLRGLGINRIYSLTRQPEVVEW